MPAGANTIIRIIAAPLVIAIIIFVAWVGVNLLDPITDTLTGPPDSLNWVEMTHFYEFMALGLVGLLLVVFVWLWVAPIREDIRQDAGPRGPF